MRQKLTNEGHKVGQNLPTKRTRDKDSLTKVIKWLRTYQLSKLLSVVLATKTHQHGDVKRAKKRSELIQHLSGGLDRKIGAASPNRVLQNVLQVLRDENQAVGLVFVVKANLQQLVKGSPWQLQVCYVLGELLR